MAKAKHSIGEASLEIGGADVTLKMGFEAIDAIESHFDCGIGAVGDRISKHNKVGDIVRVVAFMATTAVDKDDIVLAITHDGDKVSKAVQICFNGGRPTTPPGKQQPPKPTRRKNTKK